MFDCWLDAFSRIDPQTRRKTALLILLATFMLGHVNIAVFFLGVISPELMDAVTNYLSWIALTLTALDVLVGTDVRVQQDENGDGG